nr:MAG: replication initiation protein [Microvirus sp.]
MSTSLRRGLALTIAIFASSRKKSLALSRLSLSERSELHLHLGKIGMSCTKPLPAFQSLCPITGLKSVSLKKIAGREPNLQLPCNKCPSCKLRKAKEWALRCWHESQMHEQNAYVTLTYSDENLPPYENLDHRDFQLFIKRFRAKYPERKIKYFMCGEYGDKTHRPHYHVIMFGYYPPDPVYHRTENGHRYYKSKELDAFWKNGFTDTSSVSYYSAGYVARYALKKQLPHEQLQDRYTYHDHEGTSHIRTFEYVRMSTGRAKYDAIGASWFREYAAQTVMNDFVLDPNGNQCPVPKYYLSILKYDDPNWFDRIAKLRVEKAQADPDNTPERLAQKAICTNARLKQLPRPYL